MVVMARKLRHGHGRLHLSGQGWTCLLIKSSPQQSLKQSQRKTKVKISVVVVVVVVIEIIYYSNICMQMERTKYLIISSKEKKRNNHL